MSTLDVVLKPWGKYEVLTEASGYKVKRITLYAMGGSHYNFITNALNTGLWFPERQP